MKRIISLVLILMLLASSLVFADTNQTFKYIPTDNASIALIKAISGTITTAVSSDEDLATVEIIDEVAVVTGLPGQDGIVTITLNGSYEMEIPIGYTVFYFDGNDGYIINGKDTSYEIKTENIVCADGSTATKSYVQLKNGGGKYVICGTANDVYFSVKKGLDHKLTLFLAGIDLTSSYTAPIIVGKDSTKEVKINALKGSTNTLTDSAFNYKYDEDEFNPGFVNEFAESAVIKGKANADIEICGEGTLNINCNSKNAIKVGEFGELTIKDLTLNVISEKNGISSDNKLKIMSGNITVVAKNGDGIRTNPEELDPDNGMEGLLQITGGSIVLGVFDDAIHSDGVLLIGEQGADNSLININIITSNEGLEGRQVYIKSGKIKLKAVDDGINAGDGNGGGDDYHQKYEKSDCLIDISGGDVFIDSDADGIDSNGNINLTGGKIVVFSDSEFDASFDYGMENGSTFIINGATVFAAGCKITAVNPSRGSQPFVVNKFQTKTAPGAVLKVQYSGRDIYSIENIKPIDYMFYSSPDMLSASGYSLVAGNSGSVLTDNLLEMIFSMLSSSSGSSSKYNLR